jgi:hypothetical protein
VVVRGLHLRAREPMRCALPPLAQWRGCERAGRARGEGIRRVEPPARGSGGPADVERMLALYQALDEEVANRMPPTPEEIDEEIEDLVGDAWQYGVSTDQFVDDCRGHSLAFWRDWFAMDAVAERISAQPDEIAQAVFYRELARQEPKRRRSSRRAA